MILPTYVRACWNIVFKALEFLIFQIAGHVWFESELAAASAMFHKTYSNLDATPPDANVSEEMSVDKERAANEDAEMTNESDPDELDLLR